MDEIIYNQIPLKPCPFCGAGVFLYREPLWNGSHGYHGHYKYYIRCENEKCNVRPKTISMDDVYEKDKEAIVNRVIGYWNNRKEK